MYFKYINELLYKYIYYQNQYHTIPSLYLQRCCLLQALRRRVLQHRDVCDADTDQHRHDAVQKTSLQGGLEVRQRTVPFPLRGLREGHVHAETRESKQPS